MKKAFCGSLARAHDVWSAAMSDSATRPLGIQRAVRKQQRVVGAAAVSSEARALLHGNSERTASGDGTEKLSLRRHFINPLRGGRVYGPMQADAWRLGGRVQG